MPFTQVNTSNPMTFECCFLFLQYHENCNAMSSFTVLRHVPWKTFICSAVQYFHQFAMIFIYCLLPSFSDAEYSEHIQLVQIVVKKSVSRSLQLKKMIFKNRNMQLRLEIAMADIRDQLMTNNKDQLMTNNKLPDIHKIHI